MAFPPDQTASDSKSSASGARSPSIPGARVLDFAEPNSQIAEKLRQAADILAAQGADVFRIAAYRRAANSLRALDSDLSIMAERGGRAALEAIPGVGISIAGAIGEMLTTGRWAFLDHLKGTASPESLFRSVPGIGDLLAHRVCKTLHVNTLEALEAAAHDGRLEQVSGFGHRRVAMVRAGSCRDACPGSPQPLRSIMRSPGSHLLLVVDREYREKATAGELIKIAPKRFNPKGEAWLPLLHTVRDGWHFTALYSNTARAHQLGREGDWVVIYFHKDNQAEGQRTVVTETRGEAAGRRIVRGREAECRGHYASMSAEAA